MDTFFDLDKLHKKQKRSKHIKVILGVFLICSILIIGISTIDNSKPVQHLAEVSNYATNSPSKAPERPTKSSAVSSSTNDQTATEYQTQAAQDEAEAKQDIANAEKSQTALDNEKPPAISGAAVISVPTPVTTLPAPTCTEASNLSSSYNAYIAAAGQLNSFESDPAASIDTYGITSVALEAAEASKLSFLESAEESAYTAYTQAEAQSNCS